jgi:hypothetical protein
MKTSLKKELEKLFQNHSPETHLPAIAMVLELDERGMPNIKFVKARAYPVESLGMITIMKEMLEDLENEVLNEIDNISGRKMNFKTSSELIEKSDHKTELKKLFDNEKSYMDHLKNLF